MRSTVRLTAAGGRQNVHSTGYPRSDWFRCGSRVWWPEPESNQRHPHFQCGALPTELPGPQECIPKDVQNPEYIKTDSKDGLGRAGLGSLGPEPRPPESRVQQPARAIGREDADNHSVVRSCLPPVCSDRCSTSRAVPSVRPCTDTPGARIWQIQPWATSELHSTSGPGASQSLPQHDCYNSLNWRRCRLK